MWVVLNESPFAADRNWIRDQQGRHHFVVAVRATYLVDIQSRLHVADQQEPPALAPVYHGEDGVSSLRWDGDLGPLKPATDVIVNAHAHAPGRPVRELEVSIRVDGRQKVLLVRGPPG